MTLKIREAQTQPFKREARERFVEALKERLARTLPEPVVALGAPELERRISTALGHAEASGLRWESSVAVFVRLWLTVGPHFTRFPAVRALLADPAGTPDERMLRVASELTPEQWAAAARDEHTLPWAAIDEARREG